MTNYVYHFYGEDEIYLAELSYSLGTLLKKIDPNDSRVIVFTDQPAKICSLPVICRSIAGQIAEMKGPFGFGFRVKLCSILKCAEFFPGDVIYLDCDTIVRGPIREIADQLGNGWAWMYRREKLSGRFSQFEGFQMRLPNGSIYNYGAESCMFNAGIIGVHRNDVKILETALAICDELLAQGRKNHVCEQFAVSEAFRISGLKILEARKIVAHYYRTSAKKYMHHKIARLNTRLKKESWNFDRPISYSYPRVQLFKLLEKICR
jgi:hypothetical protein